MVAVSGWTEASGCDLVGCRGPLSGQRAICSSPISAAMGCSPGPISTCSTKPSSGCQSLRIQASGGVTSIADLARLRTDGAIIGKAMWEGLIPLEEALSLARA